MTSQCPYIILGKFWVKIRLTGAYFGRRTWNCFPTILCHFEEEFHSGEFSVVEMIFYIAFWLSSKGKLAILHSGR